MVIEAKIDAGFQSQQIARYSTQSRPRRSKGVLPIADAASLLTRLNVLPDISAHQEHDGSYLCVAMFPPMEADRGNVEGELTKLIRQVAQVVQ